MEKAQFEIGQVVRHSQDPEGVTSTVLGMSNNGEGWFYKITSSEVDVSRRQLIEGVKHVSEDELQPVEEQE